MNYYLAIFYKETTISFKGKKILTALTKQGTFCESGRYFNDIMTVHTVRQTY